MAMIRICLAGEGAQGFSHFASLADMAGVEVVTLCGGIAEDAQRFAEERNIPHWSLDLAECLRQV
jgi:2-hydroxy-4-carboxymuconate semialdehyde hemiacetal dehydrogenase